MIDQKQIKRMIVIDKLVSGIKQLIQFGIDVKSFQDGVVKLHYFGMYNKVTTVSFVKINKWIEENESSMIMSKLDRKIQEIASSTYFMHYK